MLQLHLSNQQFYCLLRCVLDDWQYMRLYASVSCQCCWLDSTTIKPVPGHGKFNALWPSDAIWRHRSGSILAQAMACCLTTPNHYMNPCWLVIGGDLWYSLKTNFTQSSQTDGEVINKIHITKFLAVITDNELTRKEPMSYISGHMALYYFFVYAYLMRCNHIIF